MQTLNTEGDHVDDQIEQILCLSVISENVNINNRAQVYVPQKGMVSQNTHGY